MILLLVPRMVWSGEDVPNHTQCQVRVPVMKWHIYAGCSDIATPEIQIRGELRGRTVATRSMETSQPFALAQL